MLRESSHILDVHLISNRTNCFFCTRNTSFIVAGLL
jgi:hypothetical protein